MNLSRNQKRYASILGACAVALLVDRLFLAPGEADAEEPARPSAALLVTPPPVGRAPIATESIPRKPLAERFETLADEHRIELASMTDPFEVPWETAEVVIAAPVHPGLQSFVKTHRLNAVLALESGGYAIVDGRRLRVGQEIDGFQLVEIRPRSIVLESPEFLRVELKLLDARPPVVEPEPISEPQ